MKAIVVPEIVRSILDTRLNPFQHHAMWVHLPITIAVVGAAGVFALTLTGGRGAVLRWSCVVLYLLGSLVAVVTARLGEAAMANLDVSVMTEDALRELEAHEEMGEQVAVWLGVTSGLLVFTAIRRPWWRTILLIASLVSGLGTLGWVAVTAHHGGNMVYRYGVGVPTTVNNVNYSPGGAAGDERTRLEPWLTPKPEDPSKFANIAAEAPPETTQPATGQQQSRTSFPAPASGSAPASSPSTSPSPDGPPNKQQDFFTIPTN